MELTQDKADAFARIPLTYLRLEDPNHIMHLLNDDGDVLLPRELHPIFYGCFDWHSAVHGYWLLATGYWLLATGYWLLATGYWLLATGYWLLAAAALRASLSPLTVSEGDR